MALDRFYMDNNTYIGSTGHGDGFQAWPKLLEPVAYLESMEVLRDPFYEKLIETKQDNYFELSQAKKSNTSNLVSYCIEGMGPDRQDSISTPNYGNPEGTFIPYMPSNGIVSQGDIFRPGGQWIPNYVAEYYAGQSTF